MAWLWAVWSRPAAATCHLNSGLFATDGESGGFGLEAFAADDRFGECFAGSASTFLGPSLVDFVGSLRRIGQDQHLVAGDLEEAAAHRHRFLGAAFLDADDARLKRGEKGSVARKNADDAFGTRSNDHVDCIIRQDFTFRRNDLHFQRHTLRIPTRSSQPWESLAFLKC